jgi:quercetin dioxygenase-like cupin family protein
LIYRAERGSGQETIYSNGSERMPDFKSFFSHAAIGSLTALAAGVATYLVMSDRTFVLAPSAAHAQATGQKTTDVITQTMPDLGREMRIRLTEREPGNGSAPHRHPGHHTFGYVLEGTYEVRIGDGPVRQLKAGEAFYEPPGALHAVSRNPSPDKVLKYLVIQVVDPSKPTIVPE